MLSSHVYCKQSIILRNKFPVVIKIIFFALIKMKHRFGIHSFAMYIPKSASMTQSMKDTINAGHNQCR